MLGEATGSTPQKANDALNRFSVSVHVHWCEGGGTSGHACRQWQLGEGVWRTERGAEAGKELAGAWRQGWGGAQPCKRLERGHEETARGASLSTGASSRSCRRGKALFPPVLTITASFRARGTNLSSLRPASSFAEETEAQRGWWFGWGHGTEFSGNLILGLTQRSLSSGTSTLLCVPILNLSSPLASTAIHPPWASCPNDLSSIHLWFLFLSYPRLLSRHQLRDSPWCSVSSLPGGWQNPLTSTTNLKLVTSTPPSAAHICALDDPALDQAVSRLQPCGSSTRGKAH